MNRELFKGWGRCMFLLVLVSAVSLFLVAGIGLGISPGVLETGDVAAGEMVRFPVVVSTTSEQAISVQLKGDGSLASWIGVKSIVLSKNFPATVSLEVRPPVDVSPGRYAGKLVVSMSGGVVGGGGFASAIIPLIKADVFIDVVGEGKEGCVVGGLTVYAVEEGELPAFSFAVKNTGTARLLPEYSYAMWDETISSLLAERKMSAEEWVLPGESVRIDGASAAVPVGKYWLMVEVPKCNATFLEELVVAEKGSISDVGELTSIGIDVAEPSVDTAVPMKIGFRNSGEREETVKFVGKVYRDGMLVDLMETEAVQVDPQEAINLESFYSPTVPGEYRVVGKVLFNNRVSGEKEIAFIVKNATDVSRGEGGAIGTGRSRNSSLVLAITMVVIVLVFLILIKKKKRKHKR